MFPFSAEEEVSSQHYVGEASSSNVYMPEVLCAVQRIFRVTERGKQCPSFQGKHVALWPQSLSCRIILPAVNSL